MSVEKFMIPRISRTLMAARDTTGATTATQTFTECDSPLTPEVDQDGEADEGEQQEVTVATGAGRRVD